MDQSTTQFNPARYVKIPDIEGEPAKLSLGDKISWMQSLHPGWRVSPGMIKVIQSDFVTQRGEQVRRAFCVAEGILVNAQGVMILRSLVSCEVRDEHFAQRTARKAMAEVLEYMGFSISSISAQQWEEAGYDPAIKERGIEIQEKDDSLVQNRIVDTPFNDNDAYVEDEVDIEDEDEVDIEDTEDAEDEESRVFKRVFSLFTLCTQTHPESVGGGDLEKMSDSEKVQTFSKLCTRIGGYPWEELPLAGKKDVWEYLKKLSDEYSKAKGE